MSFHPIKAVLSLCHLNMGRNKSRITSKITSMLGLGLNFAVNVDFWVCNEDFNKKSEGKNMIFVVFP